ncbi:MULTISPECIES: hypothetical protein [Tenacibaculum]|uniref:hypothetical protein n=1 Tax=Tenacibaculum TaxID=104267 RepID=UPI000C3DBE37|nr:MULTISPECIES: hypothetical protein [Tenacibaculum]MCD8440924.1 hypothetical protein [Tenacibaculum finnmarkense genomovar ulcerans]MCG8721845.1 hypothetical protein [Tenacibaculum finnmarkense]SOS56324.1 hypothetical protein TFHFJT_780001 [Tenacibaculum finnmarkense]
MTEEDKRLDIQTRFVKAGNWLRNNGIFKTSFITKNGLECGFILSFQMEEDNKPIILKGADIINLTLEMYSEVK